MNMQERRYVKSELEARALDGHKAVISGYAALFDSRSADLGGFVEQIAPGAFKRVLGWDQDTRFLFNHDESTVMARRSADNLAISEDDRGLYYEATIDLRDPDAERLFRKVEGGNVRGSSFAFRINKGGDEWSRTEDDYPLRTLREIGMLHDVSSVTTPAYPETERDGMLAAAVRSLSYSTGRDISELVAAAKSDELRSHMLPVENKQDDEAPAESHASDLSLHRYRLELLSKKHGAQGPA